MGREKTPEEKAAISAKISAKKKGKPLGPKSEETKKKMAASQLERRRREREEYLNPDWEVKVDLSTVDW